MCREEVSCRTSYLAALALTITPFLVFPPAGCLAG